MRDESFDLGQQGDDSFDNNLENPEDPTLYQEPSNQTLKTPKRRGSILDSLAQAPKFIDEKNKSEGHFKRKRTSNAESVLD